MGDFGRRKPKFPYLYSMFVRNKTNRSGTISVVVVSKAHGKFTEVKKFGVAKSEEEADDMLFLTEKHYAVKPLFDLSNSNS